MQLTTFKYRLYPTKAQERLMTQTLDVCRHWYNMCLEDRKLAWALEQRHVNKSDQEKTGIHYRKTFPKAKAVFSQTMQMVCADVDKAFKAFFRRVKALQTAGYPRFKGKQHFDSFGFKQYGLGITLDGRRLKLFGIGRVRVRWHRAIKGTIKTARICRSAGKWYVCFSCEISDPTPLPKTGALVGIDVGISALMTTSDGLKVDNPRWYRKSQHDLKLAQRRLQRKHKGSKNRRKALLTVQRIYDHVVNQRGDYLNKIVHELVHDHDLIAVEDLRIANMVRNHKLSKSILDAGWGYFRQRLTSKAVNAGRDLVFVNPAYTSKCCSNCGNEFEKFDLSVRWVDCQHCGLSLDRDHNAAINLLNRAIYGWDTSVQPNVEASSSCVL